MKGLIEKSREIGSVILDTLAVLKMFNKNAKAVPESFAESQETSMLRDQELDISRS